MRPDRRRGTVLIAIAGICALMASLGAAFLLRMRSDAEATAEVVRETQARVMLVAGCNYVLESSRLGWDTTLGANGAHREGFGWIDVRNGQPGPRDQANNTVWSDASRFPAIGGRAARCPMQVRQRPPFAVELTAAYNPIAGPESADFGLPLMTRPDPRPVKRTPTETWDSWRQGDPMPRPTSTGMSWFRCYRDSAAVFVITCGAGGTLGFADWDEVVVENAEAQFGDQASFAAILADERRLWYRIEWSAAVAAPDFHLTDNEFGAPYGDTPKDRYGWSWGGNGNTPAKVIDNYVMHPRNSSKASHGRSSRCQIHINNPVGSVRWVQRLETAPAAW